LFATCRKVSKKTDGIMIAKKHTKEHGHYRLTTAICSAASAYGTLETSYSGERLVK
jgi:hypothetical protein